MFPTEDEIRRAAQLIRDGKLVAFPTETVYGLGADALNVDAVGRIYAAKGRPEIEPADCPCGGDCAGKTTGRANGLQPPDNWPHVFGRAP